MNSMTEARNLTAQSTISPAMRAVIMPPKPKGNYHIRFRAYSLFLY